MWNTVFEHHCSDETLVSLLDGELPRGRRRVERHLSRCWACRTRLAEFERDIQRVTLAARDQGFPPPAWVFRARERFQERARPVRQAAEARQIARSGLRPFPWPGLGWSAAGVVLVALAALHLHSPERVSAAELLRKAQASDERLSRVQPGKAVRQRLKVRRKLAASGKELTGARDCWWGAPYATPAASAGEDSLLQELQSVYRVNGLDWSTPLAAGNLARWRSGLRSASDEIIHGDRVVLAVDDRAPQADENRLRSVRLWLRPSDMHPVEQELVTAKAHYSISEISYAIVDAPVAPLAAARSREPKERPGRSLLQELAPPPRLVSAADRVEVEYILHRAGICLDGTVRLEQTPEGLAIRGTVDSDSRKQSLERDLGALPAVKTEIRTTDEAAMEGGVPPAPTTALVFRSTAFAAEPALYAHFRRMGTPEAARQRTGELIDGLLGGSAAASQEAASLARLARAYPAAKVAALPPRARTLVLQMAQDHRGLVRQKLDVVRDALHVFSAALGVETAPAPPETPEEHDWDQECLELASGTGEIESRIWDLLTSASGAGLQAAFDRLAHSGVRLHRLSIAMESGMAPPSRAARF